MPLLFGCLFVVCGSASFVSCLRFFLICFCSCNLGFFVVLVLVLIVLVAISTQLENNIAMFALVVVLLLLFPIFAICVSLLFLL